MLSEQINKTYRYFSVLGGAFYTSKKIHTKIEVKNLHSLSFLWDIDNLNQMPQKVWSLPSECKQFGSRSGLNKCRALSGSNMFLKIIRRQ